MVLNLEPTDALPFVDPEPSSAARDAIIASIRADLPQDYQSTVHPSLEPYTSYQPSFSPLIESEHKRLAAEQPRPEGTGIDTSRYEALDAPPTNNLEQWRDALKKAYASSTYLSNRQTSLSLLEAYGKNSWLIGNSQLEDILKALEKELAEAKEQAQEVDKNRRLRQEGAAAEMELLEDGWKKGVRGIIEAEAAAEGLRREAMERRRAGAVNT